MGDRYVSLPVSNHVIGEIELSWESDKLTVREKLLIYSPGLIIVGVFVAIIIGVTLYTFSPDQVAKNKIWADKYNALEKQIDSMSCQQLQQIRLDSIAKKDVSEYNNHWGTIRDMYNALSCGNHWSSWED